MRAVVQRVGRASVTVGDKIAGQIGPGLLVYAAAAPDDGDDDVRYIADKVAHLRIFPDADGKMNRSVLDAAAADIAGVERRLPAGELERRPPAGAVLLVSAFTVQADARKGRRPSFDSSAPGEVAEPLIEKLVAALRGQGLMVETGRFGAHMHVASVNDGPICLLLDSRRTF